MGIEVTKGVKLYQPIRSLNFFIVSLIFDVSLLSPICWLDTRLLRVL